MPTRSFEKWSVSGRVSEAPPSGMLSISRLMKSVQKCSESLTVYNDRCNYSWWRKLFESRNTSSLVNFQKKVDRDFSLIHFFCHFISQQLAQFLTLEDDLGDFVGNLTTQLCFSNCCFSFIDLINYTWHNYDGKKWVSNPWLLDLQAGNLTIESQPSFSLSWCWHNAVADKRDLSY